MRQVLAVFIAPHSRFPGEMCHIHPGMGFAYGLLSPPDA